MNVISKQRVTAPILLALMFSFSASAGIDNVDCNRALITNPDAATVASIEAYFNSIDLSPETKFNLIEAYAPRVYMAIGEQFRPSSVDFFFGGVTRERSAFGNVEEYHLQTIDPLANEEDSSLPLFAGLPQPAPLTGNVPVYAFWARKGTSVDLIYFTFYPYNRGKNNALLDPGGTHRGNHVGDWERVTVRLELGGSAPNYSLYPSFAFSRAHSDSEQSLCWEDIPKLDDNGVENPGGTHPVAYEALDSHGTWLTPGDHVYKEVTFLNIDLVDETSAGEPWDTWNSLRAFDVLDRKRLPSGTPWPLWMDGDRNDKLYTQNQSPWAPVLRWGNRGSEPDSLGIPANLTHGPAGPQTKSDVSSAKLTMGTEICDDGVDNDGDLAVDGDDAACVVLPVKTLNVNSLVDTNSTGTLRYALQQAQSIALYGFPDEITGEPTYVSKIQIVIDPSLAGLTLNLDRTLQINAPYQSPTPVVIDASNLGEAGFTISGNSLNRVFWIAVGSFVTMKNIDIKLGRIQFFAGGGIANLGTLSMSDCTLSQNNASSGAAIYNTGFLQMTNCVLANNSNENFINIHGGALYNDGGDILLNDCVLNKNGGISTTIETYGGAIYNHGKIGADGYPQGILRLTDCVVNNNVANFGGGIYTTWHGTFDIKNTEFRQNGAFKGGGIYISGGNIFDTTAASLLIDDSSFVSNGGGETNPGDTWGASGGAIYAELDRTLLVIDSTISGNFASRNGGGIFTLNSTTDGRFKLINSTVYDNGVRTISSSSVAGSGGGVFVAGFSNLYVENSVIAGNTKQILGSPETNQDLFYDFASVSTNGNIFLGTNINTGFSPSATVGTDLNPLDPLLGPLANYGGKTQSHAPLPGSPLINAATPAPGDYVGPATLYDQRGVPRPQLENLLDTESDLGSFETGVGWSIFPSPIIPEIDANPLGTGWSKVSAITHNGVLGDVARSAPIDSNQESSLKARISGPGTLSFWWKVSAGTNTELSKDKLHFSLDDNFLPPFATILGETDWQQVTVPIAAGDHNLEWYYETVYSEVPVAEISAGWVDEVVFDPPWPPENDLYGNRIAIGEGTTQGSLLGATRDGNSSNDISKVDVWYQFGAPANGTMRINTCGTFLLSGLDTVISAHSNDGLVGTITNEVDANDQWMQGSDDIVSCPDFNDSAMAVPMQNGETLVIRVSNYPDFAGTEDGTSNFLLNIVFEADAADTDFDGVADDIDNCTLKANADQADTDGDNIGNHCDPDFDNNGIVNASDLAFFKSKFFTTDPDADLNGNGIVNAADLAILKSMFFKPPGPSGLVP